MNLYDDDNEYDDYEQDEELEDDPLDDEEGEFYNRIEVSLILIILVADFDESAEDSADHEDDEDGPDQDNPSRGRSVGTSRQDQEEDESFKYVADCEPPFRKLIILLYHSALLNTIGESDGNLYDRNALSSAEDAAIVEDMAAIRDDLALAKGFSARRRKRNRRQGSPSTGTRRKRERQRTKELQDLFEAGNVAYAAADLPEAKRNYREIIRLDATESEAWMLLAQVHREQGDEKKEIGCRLVAAHLMHDVDTWRDLAERSK